MGAGKSTLGNQLAGQIDLPFFDTDAEIERRCGADISWIFDKEGEQGFRQRETEMLQELVEKPEYIIATGGGIISKQINRKILMREGFVIYLCLGVDQQYERTLTDTKRPLLQVSDRKKKLADLFAERDPLYKEVADLVIEINQQDPKYLIQKILSAIQV